MLILTQLTGQRFALNPDLIQRVDAAPDTVITLVDGARCLVAESLDEVAELMLEYRMAVISGPSDATHDTDATHHTDDNPHLRLVAARPI